MIQRTAECACGNAKIITCGEPHRILSCHCNYCQKRTGSIFQVSAWFADNQIIEISGETKLYNQSPKSKGIQYRFCPVCGTTLYWTFNHVSGYYGIAVGCFTDANFPKPSFEIHTSKRHKWINPISEAEQFLRWPPPDYLN